ncbi:MAG TPA: porin family protein [Bacteroidales bacterium]|nr:porin family protein [Bacteroidales bacterium]
MTRSLYYTIVIVVLTLVGIDASSQSVCSGKLEQAKQLFESGQIEQIPSLLDSCLEDAFTKEEQVVAYQLLIQTYLFDYNQSKADETMTRFLTKFPTYKIKESDPAEIKELFERFESRNVWSLEVTAGGNMSHLITNQYYSIYDLLKLETSNKMRFGFSAGLQATRYIGDHFGVVAGLKYMMTNYQNTENIRDDVAENKITENTHWIALPVTFQWYPFVKKKVTPFIYAGAEAGYILYSNADFRTRLSANDPFTKGTGIDLTTSRNQFQYGITGGLGLRWKLPKGSFKVWAGYTYNLQSFAKADRYADSKAILYFQHIDDDFAYNLVYLNVSYSLDLYQIRKK